MSAGARRRGPRAGGQDTRAAILTAARTEFAGKGYEAASLRGIARAAGVDPRLVHHYFDGKDAVFAAAMELPARPAELLAGVLQVPPEQLGHALAARFVEIWDRPEGRQRIVAMLGSAFTSPDAARLLHEFISREVFGRIAAVVPGPDAALRASLAASQLAGVVVARYVVGIEPMASLPRERLVAVLGPTLQRYLTGELPEPAG